MEFILIIVMLIGFFAWEQIQPLINLPIINLTIMNIALILLWLIILLGAILIFINLLKFFLNNTLLFSPSKWQKSWVCFGLIRFALTFSLFYILYIHPTPRTSTPIFNDFSIIEFFVFSFFFIRHLYFFIAPLPFLGNSKNNQRKSRVYGLPKILCEFRPSSSQVRFI